MIFENKIRRLLLAVIVFKKQEYGFIDCDRFLQNKMLCFYWLWPFFEKQNGMFLLAVIVL